MLASAANASPSPPKSPLPPGLPPTVSLPRRIWRSFGFAFQGLTAILRTQTNFWVHLVLASAAIILGLVLRISPVEFAVIALTIGLVLAAEAFNTAFEALADVASPGYHPLVKRAKDISAAAVLLAALAALAVAACIFLPHL